MGKCDEYWWPHRDAVWPRSAPQAETVDAFKAAFATEGFTPCADGKPKQGVEKVALYTLNGKPQHAAFLLPNGKWGSKLGKGHDIHHLKLEAIGGTTKSKYGDATHFFERPEPETPRPQMPNTMYEFARRAGVTNATVTPPKKAKPSKASSKRKR